MKLFDLSLFAPPPGLFQNIAVINQTELSEENGEPNSFQNWQEFYPATAKLVFTLDISCTTISWFGLFGNLFTMLVISKWENMSSGAAFMFALAFSDFFGGVYNGIIAMAEPLIGWTLMEYNDVICAMCQHFRFTSTLNSYYATVLFSFDKCIAILLPFKYREYGKPRVAVVASLVCYFLIALWTFPTIFVFRLHPVSGQCRAINFQVVSYEFFYGTRNVIGWFVSGVVPITSVFLSTAITIGKIQFMKRKRSDSMTQASRRDREMTRQMIIVCSLFVSFGVLFAFCVRVALNIPKVKGYEDEKVLQLFLALIRNCLAVQNSANFYAYLIFGNKFRANFVELITGKKPNSKKIRKLFGLQAGKVSTKPTETVDSARN